MRVSRRGVSPRRGVTYLPFAKVRESFHLRLSLKVSGHSQIDPLSLNSILLPNVEGFNELKF